MTRARARPVATAVLFLLALSAGALGVTGQDENAADPPLPHPRAAYIIAGTQSGHTTVLQVLSATEPSGGRVGEIAVPRGAAQHEVRADDGSLVAWAEREPGVLALGPTDTHLLQIASRGLNGPTPGVPLHFGPDPNTGAMLLVVALPDDRSEPLASNIPLTPITRGGLHGSGLFPVQWPIPDDARLFWNDGPLERLPAQVDVRTLDAGVVSPYAAAAGIGVLLALSTLWLVVRIHRGTEDPTRAKRQPIMAHMEELRRRIGVVLIVLALAMAFFFSFGFRWMAVAGVSLPVPLPSLYGNAASQVFDWLSTHIVPAGVEIVVVTPFDAVLTLILLSVAMAMVATFPVLFYHVYAFLAPGLYPAERRAVLALVPAVVALLVLGAAFGIALMAPLIVRVLYGFAVEVGATALLTMSQLVGIAALMGIIFGVSFQLPLVMMATARLGLVRAATYRRKWRHAIILILIIAAFVTDPTVLTQLIVAAVLFALYGVGIVLAMLVDRDRLAGTD